MRKYYFYKATGNLGLLLYSKKFQTKWSFTPGISKTCVTALGNSKAYIHDLWKFYMIFIDHPCKFLCLVPGISIFYLEIPCPQSSPSPPVCFFSEKAHSHSCTDSCISSFWWVVNIMQKFDTLSKKRNFDAKFNILIFTVNSLHWSVV